MIFYLTHTLVNRLFDDWSESQKNCFTLLVGGSAHVLAYVTLEYLAKTLDSDYLRLISRFYLYLVVIDVITMFIVYKVYWGRSILSEVGNDREDWVLDEQTHKYSRKTPRPDDSLNPYLKNPYSVETETSDLVPFHPPISDDMTDTDMDEVTVSPVEGEKVEVETEVEVEAETEVESEVEPKEESDNDLEPKQ